jgi:phenylacetate-CoA ligase
VGTLDQITLMAEVTEAFAAGMGGFHAEHDATRRLRGHVAKLLQNTLGVSAEVMLCEPGTLPRSEGKAVRVVDRRNLYAQSK